MATMTLAAKKKQLRILVGSGAAHGVNIALGEIDEGGLDRLLDRGDELRARVIETLTSTARELSITDKFKGEEVTSNYGYLSGYCKPKSIAKQCNILRQIFPGVGNAIEKLAERAVPANAEGWFAIPKWQTVAPTYAEAVQKVLDAIKKSRGGKFYNYRDGQIVNERLRQSAKTEAMFQKLGREQKDHDILVVAAQFGLHHRGRSVRRARERFDSNEFGLGSFAVGIMLLTHPERLLHYDDLWVDCAGDEFDDPDAGARFDRAPLFSFESGRVGFGTYWYDLASGRYGSVSGFVPQS